ncbi:MAG TPA: putative metal-binding motif-containing protein, partial [Polyangiales bacterium]
HPGARDRCGDAVDDDCSGTAATSDCDGDGYTLEQGDCDDQAREVNPRASERCDGIDNDCDGQRDEGFSVGGVCSVGRGQCASTATYVCSADGSSALCPATPPQAAARAVRRRGQRL